MTERLNEQREEQAWSELGATSVAPAVARLLVGVFLATIVAVPAVQLLANRAPWPQLFATRPTACTLESFERDLEEASVVGQRLLPRWQAFVIGALGLGNEQVYPGESGWLFHRPGVDYVTGPGFLEAEVQRARVIGADLCSVVPQPDPVAALVAFRAQLADRGVELVVMPTPVKAVVAPGRFVGGTSGPLQNESFAAFVATLERREIAVFDPTPLLAAEDFLTTDTHWRPAAVARVAEALAERLEALVPLGAREDHAFRRTLASATNFGDLTTMLRLPAGQRRYRAERVETAPVRRTDAATPLGAGAEVLLLGDSFSNIYSSRAAFAQKAVGGAELDWGADAGLAEQLAFALGRPVDRIVRNAGGAHATRVALAAELVREAKAGRDRLSGVRVVVYQFAMRELAQGDWREVTLARPPAGAAATAAAGAAEARRITGTLKARGPLPRPGTVPYPEALVALHLGDVEGAGDRQEVVVYVWGMREHAWTAAARWPAGERLTLEVQPWEDVAVQQRHATTSRGELDDLELLALPAYFGEPVR